MKLKINKACDLSSISALPPRRTGGSGSRSGGVGASASASQTQSQSQQSFSQGGGGVGASLSHSQSQSQSQLSQTSLDENPLNLHLPSSTGDQRFGLHDDSSKMMPSLPAGPTCTREESQLQLSRVSSNPRHWWNTTSLPASDNRCQVVNEELERKLQHLTSSVHKVGMVLDSVQNDVIQINRAMKEASLDSSSTRQKVLHLENSIQQTLKGQDELKVLIKGSTESNPDQLSILNSNSSKLNEISSALSDWPEQMRADLGKLQSCICTKEMEGIVRAIRSLNNRPATTEIPAEHNHTTNEEHLRNQLPLTKFHPAPLVHSRKVAAPPVEERKVKVLQQKLTASGYRPPPKQETAPIRKEQKISIIIDSDDDSEGGASCMIVKNETADMEPSWMKEAREESLQILRRARKRKRREMNSSHLLR